jgi:hypothetical protein
MDVEKAQTIAQLGQVIVNSAKVELQFAKMQGSMGTDFIPTEVEATKDIAEGKSKKEKQLSQPQSGRSPLPLFGVDGMS